LNENNKRRINRKFSKITVTFIISNTDDEKTEGTEYSQVQIHVFECRLLVFPGDEIPNNTPSGGKTGNLCHYLVVKDLNRPIPSSSN
jgi:hypothetical protein